MRAGGKFEVNLTPQQDAPVSRLLLEKQFYGDLVAVSHGQMLSFVSPVAGSAGYVALERVSGTLNGLSGEFILQHNGTMTRGTPALTVTVVPDSGTGELTGLAGRLEIIVTADEHRYEFEYTLD
jgi:hypothetical protein